MAPNPKTKTISPEVVSLRAWAPSTDPAAGPTQLHICIDLNDQEALTIRLKSREDASYFVTNFREMMEIVWPLDA